MAAIWNYPTRIVCGAGALSSLPAELARLSAKRPLVIADPGLGRAGVTATVTAVLDRAGIAHAVFEGVGENPTDEHALAAIEAYKHAQADSVVALGGGSPLDVGKVVRIGAVHPLPLAQYDAFKDGTGKITHKMPPMVAIPTTAGTGSEVGRSAVLTMRDTRKKTIFFAPSLLPDVALLDPELSVGLPPKTTAATGFDALTHCIEAYCSPGDHPMADAIALGGIELIAAHLTRAVRNGHDLEARAAMLKAATMGATAFQKGLGACHSLAHPLSAELSMHHGLANALCLPAVLEWNESAVPERLARIARALGDGTSCARAVRTLRREIGLPEGLSSAGVAKEQLDRLADLAFEDPCHTENPRPCTRADLFALYERSL